MVGTPVEEASSSFCMLANSCGRGKDTDISVDRVLRVLLAALFAASKALCC